MTSLSHTLFSRERLVILEEISSTNEWIKAQLGQKLPHGTVVRAIHQVQGKGQMGSTWEVEPGKNLTFSFLLHHEDFFVKEAFFLSKWIGISLVSWLKKRIKQKSIYIKWPNDIWVENKKIAGILIENQLEGQRVSSSIIGIGININQQNFGYDLQHKATSLIQATEQEEELEPLLWEFLSEISNYYRFFLQKYWAFLDKRYLQEMMGYQQLCNFEHQGRNFQAWIDGVERNGRLRLKQGGELQTWDIKELTWKGIA
ncbi:MAG: biotin--[acetyl-CoA-carboxylase] ligase [Bacteroidota bacterium]